MQRKRPIALIILDGCGLNPSRRGNAVWAAHKPVIERLFGTRPWATLGASGEDVGLMAGQMGDSNVGHLNIGAGRIVYQYVQRILRDIAQGTFYENAVLREAMEMAKARRRPLHLLGLVSPGGVHSHQEHLYALLRMAHAR
ncbi:MAG TPA: 2,3-bisphosphoglycerate-independent phosphoglycerate mutase, partial [Limnochordia bacterium]